MTAVSLKDGVPQIVRFSDVQDVTKYFVYDPPEGEAEIMINIQSKTVNFYPKLILSVTNYEEDENGLGSPYSKSKGFSNYDMQSQILKAQYPLLDSDHGGHVRLTLHSKIINVRQGV